MVDLAARHTAPRGLASSMSAAADTFWPFLDARDDDDDDDDGTINNAGGGGDFTNGVGSLDGPDALVRDDAMRVRIFCG